MPTPEYFAEIAACQTDEEIVVAVNAALELERERIGADDWEALGEDWILDDLDSTEEIQESAKELRDDAESRKEDEDLEAIFCILDTAVKRYQAIKTRAAAA